MMMVPTYSEDDSRALKVYQHQHHGSPSMVVRVGHKAPVVRGEGTIISRLRRPIRLEPTRADRAHRALCDREGGGWWHVRPHACCVYPREKVRRGIITLTPRIGGVRWTAPLLAPKGRGLGRPACMRNCKSDVPLRNST